MTIREIQLVSHTHTDFGFTDYPDTVFRHHNRIIDRAIEVCEAEAERDDAAQFRWTCEVAAITENWLQTASSSQIDRFLALHRQGKMGIGGMLVHWTPLVSPANAARSMRAIDRLRRDYELDVDIAWQCDVNGLGWHWVDLLLDMGIKGMVLAPNPHRGMPFETQQRMFNWQSPSGRTLPALHGWHYSVGAWGFFLGDDDMDKTQAAIDRMLANLEARGGYDHEAILCQVTNPAAIDNGFPTNISAFVERWNAEGRRPFLRLSTLDQAFDALLADPAVKTLPTWTGDWTDYWADGVGSTAFETALARETERHLPALDLFAALREKGEHPLLDKAMTALQFYDEHTWGAFCSVIAPDSPFSRSHLSWKTGRAFESFALTQEALAEEARDLARERTGGPVENDIPIRRGTTGPTSVEEQSYWVLNPTSRPLQLRWPVTWDYGGAAPQTILHAHLTNDYHQDMKVDRPGFTSSATHILSADLPPFGEAVIRPVAVEPRGTGGPGWIETAEAHLEVDPRDGSIARLVRRRDERDWLAGSEGLGRLVYEDLADPTRGRASIFGETGDWQYDWSRLETIAWPKSAPQFNRRTAPDVVVRQARSTMFGPEIDVDLAWPHGDKARITYRLAPETDRVDMRISVDKVPVTTPESMHLLFGLPGADPQFQVDVGDQTIAVDSEQVPESSRAWVTLQKYAAMATEQAALVVASPDVPLVQPGGIHTDRATHPDLSQPVLAFWLFNNHWDVNFAAAQTAHKLTFRFSLQLSDTLDLDAARLHAEAATVRPTIVRAYDAAPMAAKPLLTLSNPALDMRIMPADDADAYVVTLINSADHDVSSTLTTTDRKVRALQPVDPVGRPVGDVREGNAFILGPRSTTRLRLLLA